MIHKITKVLVQLSMRSAVPLLKQLACFGALTLTQSEVRTSAKPMRGRILLHTVIWKQCSITKLAKPHSEKNKPIFGIFQKPLFGSYLVDPASSHMLVSKIKPCMSKYKYCTAKLQTAH